MTRLLLAALLTGLALPTGAVAQARPDFSGTWAMDLPRSQSPTYPTFRGPVTQVITHTPAALTIETTRGDRTERLHLRADGTRMRTDREPDMPEATAYWEGPRLVVEIVRTIQGKTVRTKEVRTLDETGTMRVETILIVEHGYSVEGGQNYGAAVDYYTRQPTS